MKDKCSITIIHQDVVDKVADNMPGQSVITELTDFFKILGDPTRIKILYSLLASEMCVCDLSAVLNISQSAISHQLKSLRKAELVKFRREGKTVFYSLDDDDVKNILKMGKKHFK